MYNCEILFLIECELVKYQHLFVQFLLFIMYVYIHIYIYTSFFFFSKNLDLNHKIFYLITSVENTFILIENVWKNHDLNECAKHIAFSYTKVSF